MILTTWLTIRLPNGVTKGKRSGWFLECAPRFPLLGKRGVFYEVFNMKPNVVENAPLIVPSGANAKSSTHRIYANEEGLRLLIDMCHQALSSGRRVQGAIRQNQEMVNIELIPSTEEDFDCGGDLLTKLLKRGEE